MSQPQEVRTPHSTLMHSSPHTAQYHRGCLQNSRNRVMNGTRFPAGNQIASSAPRVTQLISQERLSCLTQSLPWFCPVILIVSSIRPFHNVSDEYCNPPFSELMQKKPVFDVCLTSSQALWELVMARNILSICDLFLIVRTFESVSEGTEKSR